jgi:hypothetical protein
MAKNKPTPEEQLLNLIEDTEGPGSLGLKRKKSSPLSRFSFNSLFSFLAHFKLSLKDIFVRIKGGIDEPNLKVWNKILMVASAILFVYLSADFMLRRLDLKQFIKRASSQKARNFEREVSPEVKPFLYYLEMVQRRDIFAPVKLEGAENPQEETKKELAAILKELKLVGISLSGDPEVIIEDMKANKTYFLKEGDSINNFKIDKF